MSVSTPQFSEGSLRLTLTGANATGAAGLGAVANPEGEPIYVTDLIVYKTTGSTGAAVLNAGITTISAESDNLIDGGDLEGTGTAISNQETPGTNGKGGKLWPAASYLTFTGSADSSGLVAEVIVSYKRITT